MFSDSCETCLKQTINPIFSSKCLWVNDACISETQFKYNPSQRVFNSLSRCSDLRLIASTSTIRVTTTSPETLTTTITTTRTSAVLKTENLPDSFDHLAVHSPSVLNYEIDAFNTKSNSYNQYNDHKTILILVAVFALFTALVLGIIFGCVLKALYYRKLLNFFCKDIRASRPIEKKLKTERSQIRLSTTNEASKIRMARSHDFSSEKASAHTDDDSFGSNKSNCAFIYSSKKPNQNSEIKGNYFTVQNEYGIFPKSAASTITTDATNLTNETRLSSTVSSVDSSSYALINLINSHTCLLNTSKDATNQLKSINENSDLARYPPIKLKHTQESSFEKTVELKNRVNKNFSFTSSSTPSSYSPSATAAAIIESTYSSSIGSRTQNDKYQKHHHTKRKSLNFYQTKSPSYNQEIISITSSPNGGGDNLVEVNSNIYLQPNNIRDFYQNNSYV